MRVGVVWVSGEKGGMFWYVNSGVAKTKSIHEESKERKANLCERCEFVKSILY